VKIPFAAAILDGMACAGDDYPEVGTETAWDAPTSPFTRRREIVPGAVFSNCRILSELGQGGMGTVYLAERVEDDVQVVVKFLASAYVTNPQWRSRFVREATVAGQIDHPNVVHVYGVAGEGPQPHLVMEHVRGMDLEELLEQEGPLPARLVARIGRDVALGLAAAHAQGVIHRDVKPGNVRRNEAGHIKLLDFGLAKAVETDQRVTLAGQVLGTPWYMAPEQWGEHSVDPRADIYALGATLYHLLSGCPPYVGRRPLTIYRNASEGRCRRPSRIARDVPESLELVILRMLAVDRRARWPTASACADALQASLDGKPVRVPSLLLDERVIPLVPAPIHVLGRGEDADVDLAHRTVSRSHARLRLGVTGYELVDLRSTSGTRVNGRKIDTVLLKSDDVIRCGDVELRFKDGGLGVAPKLERSLRHQNGRLQVTTLPEPFLDHLVAHDDRRAVVPLLERLPLEAIHARVDSSLAFLSGFLDEEPAAAACTALRKKLLARRSAAAKRLFQITFENLHDDCAGWLTWWDEHHGDYPPQLGPQRLRPHARLHVLDEQGKTAHSLELTERMRTTVGRDPKNDICLDERSLSRRHATVLRLHQRLMIHDDGSRYGTQVGDRRVVSAFLADGDRITLGKVRLECEVEDLVAAPPQTPEGYSLVDPKLFGVLCDLEQPCVAQALHRFLRFTEDLEWVERQAARLYEGVAQVRGCVEAVRAAYARNAQRALRLLPQLVPTLAGVDPGAGGAGWDAALEAAHLGPQVLPVGWFQPTASPGPATASAD